MQERDDDRTGRRADVGAVRTGDQRRRDAESVGRQRAALLPGKRSQGFQDQLTQLLAERRAGGDVEQFDVHRVPGEQGSTVVVRGALLVRPGLALDEPELYARLIKEVGGAEERLDGRLLVLSGNDVRADRLVELAREVRAAGHEASADHVVPLGVICKGEGGPARTELASLPAGPAPGLGAVLLSVIDTGVAVKGHEHDWQSALLSADNVDALDAFPLPGGDGLLDAAAGHGAFATGVVQQVAPAGNVRVRRAVDSDGIGSEVRVAEQLLVAVREDRAEVVNLSLGVQTVDDQPLLAFQVALELLSEGEQDDVLLVAAAGNYGDTRPCWPAAFRRVVAVAALTSDLKPAPWSSHGHWVDVSTVGEGVVSTYVRGREDPALSPGTGPDDWPMQDSRPWAVWSGTSFAAPQVAAEVARRLAEQRAAGDLTATPRAVLVALLAGRPRLPDYGVPVPILSGTPVPT